MGVRQLLPIFSFVSVFESSQTLYQMVRQVFVHGRSDFPGDMSGSSAPSTRGEYMMRCPECQKESIVLTSRCWHCGHGFTLEDRFIELPQYGSVGSGDQHPSGGGSNCYWIL